MGTDKGEGAVLNSGHTRYLTLDEAAGITGGKLRGTDMPLGPALRTDSRKVQNGDGFIALSGTNTDGHAFIDDAISRGASYIVVEENKAGSLLIESARDISFLLVEDTPAALRKLAAHVFRRKSSLREVIAVTGTVGKTTTRECISAVLKKRFRVHSARESYNTWIGCALTILEMPLDTEILILEMGTNHPGEIADMTASYPPTTAVITAIGPGHLEGLENVRGVLEEKIRVLDSPRLKRLLYNGDSEILEKGLDATEKVFDRISAGFRKGTYRLKDMGFSLTGDTIKTHVGIIANGKSRRFTSLIFGPQHAYAFAYAVAMGDLFKIEDEQMQDALEMLGAISGRGTVRKTSRGIWCIDETYNANPLSMKQALENLARLPVTGKKYAVLGGMKELGRNSTFWHQDILRTVRNLDLEGVFLVGEEWKGTGKQKKTVAPFLHYCSPDEVSRALDAELSKDDALLLKGSRAYGLEKILTEAGCLK
jgi:UDP-N-acetylmuramoyl-tripeptide--D-alanyl-D-alanine ligase